MFVRFSSLTRRAWLISVVVVFVRFRGLSCFDVPRKSLDSRRERCVRARERLTPKVNTDDLVQGFQGPGVSRSLFIMSAMTLLPVAAGAASQFASSSEQGSNQDIDGQSSLTMAAAADPSSLQESISGFFAGAALAASKTLVKFPLDTATVRLQMPNSEYSLLELNRLFSGSFNGVTLSLLSNIPGGAVFFAVKDATKAGLKNSALSAAPKWVTTSLAVGAALIPYWLVRNPSEVIKVRQQAGVEGYGDGVSAIEAVRWTFQESNGTWIDGIGEFYTGYWENVVYGLPADVIKFVAYESLSGGRKDLSPLEGAKVGAMATAIAQIATTPLDVIRNRLMTGKYINGTPLSREEKEKNYIESLVSLARDEGVDSLFAGSIPRIGKAILSGAIQFATYEETKQSVARLLQRSKSN